MQGLEDFTAGWAAGAISTFVGHPLDTVKVRIQTKNQRTESASALQIFKNIAKAEGARGLYKGVMSPMTGIAAQNALLFMSFGAATRALAGPDANEKDLSVFQNYLAGGFAGGVCIVVTAPIEVMKIKLQNQRSLDKSARGYTGYADVFRHIGVRGAYEGALATTVRDVPGFGFYFAAYCAADRALSPADGSLSVPATLTAGSIAGVAGWAITYPFDVVKSRLQASGTMIGAPEYSGIVDCFRKSYKADGFGVFYKGIGVTMARAIPVNASCFMTFELTLKLIERLKA